jgi:hypothetical protein
VLEKLGMLQTTMVALKELARHSHEMNTIFVKESQEMTAEVTTQIDALGPFDDQQRLLESLQVRIHSGREKVKALSDRVDTVRERIEGWERADRAWQERTRRRLKAIWLVTSVLLGLLLLLYVVAQFGPAEGLDDAAGATMRSANNSLNTLTNGTASAGDSALADMLGSQQDGPEAANASGSDPAIGTEDFLRVFDEL